MTFNLKNILTLTLLILSQVLISQTSENEFIITLSNDTLFGDIHSSEESIHSNNFNFNINIINSIFFTNNVGQTKSYSGSSLKAIQIKKDDKNFEYYRKVLYPNGRRNVNVFSRRNIKGPISYYINSCSIYLEKNDTITLVKGIEINTNTAKKRLKNIFKDNSLICDAIDKTFICAITIENFEMEYNELNSK